MTPLITRPGRCGLFKNSKMVQQIKKFNPLFNSGWDIHYLDNKNKPHTYFINRHTKDEALRKFKEEVSYTMFTGSNQATFED